MGSARDSVDSEMHDLNQEADYLDERKATGSNGVNGDHKRRPSNGSHDLDAQAQVIDSLRTQVQDLFSQVSQLNNKLVRSYDRVSDLEDELHVTSSNLRSASLKVSQLELERTHHLSALSTGLLVEKSHVTTELTRLMEKATEEAARAGEAESARNAIEKDLDDLSANLFNQANIMVAEARIAQAKSERKVDDTEQALKGAEEIVGMLQTQMQALQAEKDAANKKAEEMQILVGKGKWVDRMPATNAPPARFLCVHSPYTEYVQFIAHLRSVRSATPTPPPVPTLISLPFLARLVTEDSEPTVRLDLAPSLNWLTRRSVISAIHSGQLTIEPMSTHTLLEEIGPSSNPGHIGNTHINCALCGSAILDCPPSSSSRPSLHPSSPTRGGSLSKASWGTSFLKASLVQSISTVPGLNNHLAASSGPSALTSPPTQVYIFKLETSTSSGLPVPLPLTSQQTTTPTRTTIYPLCTSGWCLNRLRSTCSLWAFVRSGIVEKLWEEGTITSNSHLNSPMFGSDSELTPTDSASSAAKKSRIGIGAFWGSMSRSLSKDARTDSEKASVPEPSSHKDKDNVAKEGSKGITPPVTMIPRRLPPPPPPLHPQSTLPPLPPRRTEVVAPVATHPPSGPPPPLPKRNRQRTASPIPIGNDNKAAASEGFVDDHTSHPNGAAKTEATSKSPPEDTHEDFTTPVEDLPLPNMRPLSPADIPLPLSIPATPVHTATSEKRLSGSPSRLSTPPPLRLSEEGATRSSPSSKAPPPLPRRAAGRARPSSLSLAPPILPSSEAASVVNTERPSNETPPQIVGRVTEESKAVVEPADVAQINAETLPPTIPCVDEDVDAVEQKQADVSGSDDEHVLHTTSDSVRSLGNAEDIEIDSSMYAGLTTWEERTWRELARLREDMFWARIGCLR